MDNLYRLCLGKLFAKAGQSTVRLGISQFTLDHLRQTPILTQGKINLCAVFCPDIMQADSPVRRYPEENVYVSATFLLRHFPERHLDHPNQSRIIKIHLGALQN